MSKMKEIDSIAQGVADYMKELLYDTVEWQISDQPFLTAKVKKICYTGIFANQSQSNRNKY